MTTETDVVVAVKTVVAAAYFRMDVKIQASSRTVSAVVIAVVAVT